MQKAKTAAWKAKSTRNRHNGHVNADTLSVINHPRSVRMTDSNDKEYTALKTVSKIVLNPEGVAKGSEPETVEKITFRIVAA